MATILPANAISACRCAAGVVLITLAVLAPVHRLQAAGGAYFVDDVEIGAPGSCKVESWVAFASNRDFIGVTSPACVANLGRPVELTATFARFHSGDVWGTGLVLKGKTNLVPVATGNLGVGLLGGVALDLVSGEATGAFAAVPLTLKLTEELRLNVNAGWSWDASAGQHFAVLGGGFEWNFVKPLTLIGEVFAVVGPEQSNPRFQAGLRYTPVETLDIDVIYGRNLTGEQANWITVGLNMRFNPNGK